jgi:HK97 family phage major capsid protein/HK97 family phage prohead protease
VEIIRGYAVLTVKAFDEEARTFTGMASTPELDRAGHRIDPLGVTFKNPLPLLFHHDRTQPIGTVELEAPTAAGVAFRATIARILEPGKLKDRTDEAWQSIKAGIIRGISPGLRALEDGIKFAKDGSITLLKTEFVELSLVTIPANIGATILTVKAAAMGQDPLRDRSSRAKGAIMNATTREQITTWENTRAATVARMDALMKKAADTGETLAAAESEEYDGLELKLAEVDKHLVRLHGLEKLELASATPINGGGNGIIKAAPRVVSLRPNVPPGTAFVRYAIAKMQAKGDLYQALEIAKQWKDSTPEVELMVKAAVAPGTTTDPTWAGPLAQVRQATNEFIDLLRPATILGRIPNFRSVPFNVSVPVQTAGGAYSWVGQAAPKPVTKLAFGTATLGITKAAGIIVFTYELARLSSPSIEDLVRNDMIKGIAKFLDEQFILPGVAPVAGVAPGSITNGIAPIVSTDDPAVDLHALVSKFATGNVSLRGAALVMSETNAFTLGMMKDGMGNQLYPGVSAEGGTVLGIRLVPSNAAADNVVLIAPELVLMADEGGVEIDVSREASVQMNDAPDNPQVATSLMTSLWQNNLVGLRAERFINWKRGLDAGVAVVTGAAYVPPASAPAA